MSQRILQCNWLPLTIFGDYILALFPQTIIMMETFVFRFPAGRMYCLELMQPNDMFAEFVKAGQPLGKLSDDDLCVLAALGCGGVLPGESSA